MKVKTDLFAHVGVVKSQELSGNVTHEMLYHFPSYSVYFSRETGQGFIYVAFAKSEADTFDKLIFLKSIYEGDPEDLKSGGGEFDPYDHLQDLILMVYDPIANHLKLNPPLVDQFTEYFCNDEGRKFSRFFNTSTETDDAKLLATEAFPELIGINLAHFILNGNTDTEEFPNWDTKGVWLKGLSEVSNAGFIGNDRDGIFVLKKDVEAEIDTETKIVTINGNVYEGRMSKTEFDTNPDAPEYQDVVLNDDVFDVQSLSVLYFAKK